jgi:WD40 repeat protein
MRLTSRSCSLILCCLLLTPCSISIAGELQTLRRLSDSPFRFGDDLFNWVLSDDEQYMLSRRWRTPALELRRLSDGVVERTIDCGSAVIPLALSPDNRFVVVDKVEDDVAPAILLRIDEVREATRIDHGHEAYDYKAVFAPNSKRVAVFSTEGLTLVETAKGKEVHTWTDAEVKRLYAVGFNKSNELIVFGGEGNLRISLKEPFAIERLDQKPQDGTALVSKVRPLALHYRCEGPSFLGGCVHPFYGVRDVSKKEPLWEQEWKGVYSPPKLSNDGRFVARIKAETRLHSISIGYPGATIELLDAKTGKLKRELLAPLDYPRQHNLEFTAKSRYFLAKTDYGLHVWDIETGRRMPYCQGPETIRQLHFSPDGTTVFAQDVEGFWAWDVASGEVKHHQFEGRLAGVMGDPLLVTYYSLQGRFTELNWSRRQTERTWQAPDEFASFSLGGWNNGELERVTHAVVSRDQILFANALYFGAHDLKASKTYNPFVDFDGAREGPFLTDPATPNLCCFTVAHWDKKLEPTGKLSIAVVDWRKGVLAQRIALPDLREYKTEESWQSVRGAPQWREKRLYCAMEVSESQDDSIHARYEVLAFDRSTGKVAQHIPVAEIKDRSWGAWGAEYDTSQALALSSDGRRMALGLSDGRVFLLDAANGREVAHVEVAPSPVNAVQFSPDGRLLAAGTKDGQVVIWRIKE